MTEGYQPVAKASEIKPGERKIVTVKGKEIGIFNVEGSFYAFLNYCPHMGAPLCKGRLEKEIQAEIPGGYKFNKKILLRCPWHGWEFELETGHSIFDESIRAKSYQVAVSDGMVYCKI